jgi:large subunit ribosomal protein L24
MKSKYSTSWISSKQPRKQRKYRYNAPLHIMHKFLSVNLSKELRKKYGKRGLPIRKGDEVLIKRGSFAKKKGKIIDVNLKKSRLIIEGISRKKQDGTKVNVYFNPSNLQIQNLFLDDSRRLKRVRKEIKSSEKKEIKQEENNVLEKK